MTATPFPFPTPTPYDATRETLEQYALRVLAFVVAHNNMTISLSDRDLELVAHFAPLATRYRADESPAIVETIRRAVAEVGAALRRRQAMRATPAIVPAPVAATPTPPPAGGSRVPLTPRPKVNPPAPAVAVLDF